MNHPAFFPRFSPVVTALLLAVWVAMPRTAQAQRERLVVRVEQFGATNISQPAGTFAPQQFDQQALQVNLSNRFVRDRGSSIVIVGGQWRALRLPLPRAATTGAGASAVGTSNALTTLHTATADLMLLRTVGERHTVVGVLRPGLYGDALRVEGAAFVDRIISPRTTIGAGLSYASSFGQLLPIPVVHVVSRASRRVLIDALLPARADVWYMPRKGLDIGVNASLAGALYGLTTTQANAQGVAGATSVGIANATIGPQVRWSPRGGKWQLTADAGTTILRRAEYVRGSRMVADLAPGNVPYLRAGVQRLF
jgi:hypothetical protein